MVSPDSIFSASRAAFVLSNSAFTASYSDCDTPSPSEQAMAATMANTAPKTTTNFATCLIVNLHRNPRVV